jgi:hypothetical protein
MNIYDNGIFDEIDEDIDFDIINIFNKFEKLSDSRKSCFSIESNFDFYGEPDEIELGGVY